MFGDYLEMDPARHELLPDGPWVKQVREMVKNDRIFVYRHRETKNFVVCEWAEKPREYGMGRATCTELFVVDDAPDHSPTNMPSMATVVHRCRPMVEMFDERRKIHGEKEYEKAAGEAESNQQRLEAVKWMKKKGLDEAARGYEVGASPYVADGQSSGLMEETVDELNSLASDKTFSTSVVGEKRAKHKM